MSATNVGPPIEGDSDTLQVAQEIMRLASSPWSSPTPESLEMALAIYQAARRIQSPNPPGYEIDGSNEIRILQQQLDIVMEELRATRQELREAREETARAVLALNERLEHLIDSKVGQSYKSDTVAESVEEEAEISSATEATVVETPEAEEPTMISTEPRREVVLSLIQAEHTQVTSEIETRVLEPEPTPAPQASDARWAPTSVGKNRLSVDDSSPDFVERKVMVLLNKLSTENFDSVSDQIVQWANKSENEKDCAILILVIRLIFEKATDESHWAEMYAKLCKKTMDTLSPKIRADNALNKDGEPVVGGQLFRRFLLIRCQEEFQNGWFDETTEVVPELGTAEYYTRAKVKRQGLGLVRFIGELFKLQMLTERVIHECIKKLLPSETDAPREAEIETLCKLLITVGERIDVPKSKAYMDIYFGRIGVVANNSRVASRIRYMIQLNRVIIHNLQPMSASPVGPPSEGGSDALSVAQHLMRLASSPWSSPTPESLEMALAVYQAALKVQHPPDCQKGLPTEVASLQQRLDIVTEELRLTRQELQVTREETARGFRAMNERLDRLLGASEEQSHCLDVAEHLDEEVSCSRILLPYLEADRAPTSHEPSEAKSINQLTVPVLEIPRHLDPDHKAEIKATPVCAVGDTSQNLDPTTAATTTLVQPWAPSSVGRNRAALDESSPEFVEQKVKALLNKLTFENFDSVSDQIVNWVNKSKPEKSGATLGLVIKLVFEKATDESHWAEMYARLCRKMMEKISPTVHDNSIRNRAGELIVGGQLFAKLLVSRCQKNFNYGWVQAEASKAGGSIGGEPELGSSEDYIRVKAKRQGIGLVHLIGELFKLQMLTDRIVH
ncbi:hypothetical protein FS837_003971, partial [Tulasnella sp. UAMH 9824]